MAGRVSDWDGIAAPVETPGCVLCGCDDLRRCSADLRRVGHSVASRFHLTRCSACCALQTRPLPTAEELDWEYGWGFTWRPPPSAVTAFEQAYRRFHGADRSGAHDSPGRAAGARPHAARRRLRRLASQLDRRLARLLRSKVVGRWSSVAGPFTDSSCRRRAVSP